MHDKMEARPSTSCSRSSSKRQDSKCYYKAAEFACSACLFCVSCPLSIVWCCIKLPCEIGWKAAGNAKHWTCCGSEKIVYAAYSSFSDTDSDSLPIKVGKSHCNTFGSCKNRVSHKANELQCKRSAAS